MKNICVLFITLLMLGGCSTVTLVRPESERRVSNAVSSRAASRESLNPIDEAFSRLSAERPEASGDVLSYLYALSWYEEYLSLRRELNGMEDIQINDYEWQLIGAGGRGTYGAVVPSEEFEKAAHFYRLHTFDLLEQLEGKGIGMTTDAEELYGYLSGVGYNEPVPVVYESILDYEKDPSPMPVYAALPERDIYLAFAPPFGVVLSVKGEKSFYPWAGGWLTPRAIMPRLEASDFDQDGDLELAVCLYVGSGTGVSVSELHIVELYGQSRFAETAVTSEELEDMLFHRLSAAYDPATNKIEVRLDGMAAYISAPEIDERYAGAAEAERAELRNLRALDTRSIVGFDIDDGLSVKISIGLCGFGYVTPFDYVDFCANVNYDGSFVSLSDCRIEYGQ